MDKIVFHRCQNALASGRLCPPDLLLGFYPGFPGDFRVPSPDLYLRSRAKISQIQHW